MTHLVIDDTVDGVADWPLPPFLHDVRRLIESDHVSRDGAGQYQLNFLRTKEEYQNLNKEHFSIKEIWS